jgi:hypothetical protein
MAYGLDEVMMKKPTAVLIEGNWDEHVFPLGKHPNYQRQVNYYNRIEDYLKNKGYSVTRDKGLPKTMPPEADLWVGHSRGVGRFRWAPEGQDMLAFGSNKHRDDEHWKSTRDDIVYANHPLDGRNKPRGSGVAGGSIEERRSYARHPDSKYHFYFSKDQRQAIDNMAAKHFKKANLYHSSPYGNINELALHPSHALGGEHAVFGTPDRALALSHLQRWRDSDIQQGRINTAPLYMREQYPGAFDKVYGDRGGYLYHLPVEGFESDPRLMRSERISRKPVTPLRKEYIGNAIKAMRDEGVVFIKHKDNKAWQAYKEMAGKPPKRASGRETQFRVHYNKPAARKAGKPQITVHYKGKCNILDNVVTHKPMAGKIDRKYQPNFQMVGYARPGEFIIKDNIAYIGVDPAQHTGKLHEMVRR